MHLPHKQHTQKQEYSLSERQFHAPKRSLKIACGVHTHRNILQAISSAENQLSLLQKLASKREGKLAKKPYKLTRRTKNTKVKIGIDCLPNARKLLICS